MSLIWLDLCEQTSQECIDALQSTGLLKTTDFVSKDAEEIAKSTDIAYKDVLAIRKVVLAKYGAMPVSAADLYSSVVTSTAILSTGVQGVDSLLDGGLYTGEVTEVAGDVASGKTQLCFHTSVSVARERNQSVLYLDTGGVFSAQRLVQIIEEQGHKSQALDTASNHCLLLQKEQNVKGGEGPSGKEAVGINNGTRGLSGAYNITDCVCTSVETVDEVLDRIHCCHVFTMEDVYSVLAEVRAGILGARGALYESLKLVILDCVAAVVYPFLGGGSFAENQALLCTLGHHLRSLAVDCSVAVLITNNLVVGPDGSKMASLGRAWSHAPHVRLMIGGATEESRHGQRTPTVLKSCRGVLMVHTRIVGDEVFDFIVAASNTQGQWESATKPP